MKATGIVRRIDDLGRVVIPKEIRRTMRIREGDPLEIYTDRDGEVIFKKYSPMGELSDFAVQLCDTMGKTTGHIVAICDRDTIIATNVGARRDLLEKRITGGVETIIEGRNTYQKGERDAKIPVAEGDNNYFVSVASPILAEGDVSGCVMFLSKDEHDTMGDAECKILQTVSGFLGKQMEN
ncbi:MAG: AbrB/MazE/SpoVT family DNA-binding domain-containing protein [Clostridia bacterium]|nr:AbrB/MazE/SpoVT family DNA-binding domain-containing protein [Clostridia bacterium]